MEKCFLRIFVLFNCFFLFFYHFSNTNKNEPIFNGILCARFVEKSFRISFFFNLIESFMNSSSPQEEKQTRFEFFIFFCCFVDSPKFTPNKHASDLLLKIYWFICFSFFFVLNQSIYEINKQFKQKYNDFFWFVEKSQQHYTVDTFEMVNCLTTVLHSI